MRPGITVVIATYPARWEMFFRALRSVLAQTVPPDTIVIANDVDAIGGMRNRQRGVDQVTTEWTAILDDDDEFKREHLETLYRKGLETDADMVFSWFDVVGGTDPFPPAHEFKEFDPDDPHQTTITTLFKTEAFREVGGYLFEGDQVDPLGNRIGEDYMLSMRMARGGKKIVKCPGRTWLWHHHGRNTSGLAERRGESVALGVHPLDLIDVPRPGGGSPIVGLAN